MSYQRNIALENEIVSLLQQGDKRAVSLLYRHYAPAIFGIIKRMVPAQEIAEEVLQDVFVKVWDHAKKYDSTKGRLFTWLAQIARNTALDTLRSAAYRKGQKTGELGIAVSNDGAFADYSNISDSGLRDVIGSLDEKYRVLIEYVYFKGYTQAELAEELSIPIGTVKTRVRAAVNELRNILGNEMGSLLLLLSAWAGS